MHPRRCGGRFSTEETSNEGVSIIPIVLSAVITAVVTVPLTLLFRWLLTWSGLKVRITPDTKPLRDRGRLTFQVTIENRSEQGDEIIGLAFFEGGEPRCLQDDCGIEKGDGIRGHDTVSGRISVTLPPNPDRYGYFIIRTALGREMRLEVPIPSQ